MARLPGNPPANYATKVECTRVYNLQYPGDQLVITAKTAANGVCGATGWRALDFEGNVAASGPWSGTTVTIGTAGIGPFSKYGLLTFQLTGPDRGDGQWGSDYGTCRIHIAELFSQFPTALLRSTNPAYVADGLDAPLAHGLFSLGGFRIAAQVLNINAGRQTSGNSTNSGTSVSVTFSGAGFGGAITGASNVIIVHVVFGDASGMSGPSGFVEDASTTIGSGATALTMKIYRAYAGLRPEWTFPDSFPTFVCQTTNAVKQSMWAAELGPSMKNSPPLAVRVIQGTGTTATLTQDFATLFPNGAEYGLMSMFAWNPGSSVVATATPKLTLPGTPANMLVSIDAFGGGVVNNISYDLSPSTNYVGVMVGYPGSVPYSNVVTSSKALADARWNVWGQYSDPHRPPRQVTLQSFAGQASNVPHYVGLFTQLSADMWNYKPGFLAGFTGRNEPYDFSIEEARTLADAFKAGNAQARVGGPDWVSMPLQNIDDFFILVDAGMYGTPGGLKLMTFHDYNMCNGDIQTVRRLYTEIRTGLDQRGLSNLDIFMTEGGQYIAYTPGVHRLQAAGVESILNTIAREVILRVPYERQYHYYDRRGGYDDVQLWASAESGPYAGWLMHRAYAREVYGKNLQQELDFGDVYKNVFIGGLWVNPADGTKMIGVVSCKGTPMVSFGVGATSGSVPATLTKKDHFGNPTEVAVAGNSFSLTFDERPTYIEIPAGVDVFPRPVKFGRSLSVLFPTSRFDSAEASPGVSTRLLKINDNSWNSPSVYAQNNPDQGDGYANTTGTFPRSIGFTFSFNKAVKGDTISVYCPNTYQGVPALMNGKIQYTLDGSSWLDGLSILQQSVSVKNWDYNGDTGVDAYTVPQHYFEVRLLSPQMIKGVRVLANSGTPGMYLDALMKNPGDPTKAISSAWIPQISIGEISVYNRIANVTRPAMA